MKSKKIQEKIEFLVEKWLDEAELESIIEYAGDKLREFYEKSEDEEVEDMYKESQLQSRPFDPWGSP